jgi:hypothetical protein
MFAPPKLSGKSAVRAAMAAVRMAGTQVEIVDEVKGVAWKVAPLVEASEEVETLGEVQVGAEVVRLEAGAEQAMEEAEEAHHVEEARAVTVVVAVVVAVVVQDKTEA